MKFKKAMTTKELLELILGAVGFVFLAIFLWSLINPSWSFEQEAAKSYLDTLKDELGRAERGDMATFYLWPIEEIDFYTIYFGGRREVSFMGKDFIASLYGKSHQICICYLADESYWVDETGGTCFSCTELKYPAVNIEETSHIVGSEGAWITEAGYFSEITFENYKYVFNPFASIQEELLVSYAVYAGRLIEIGLGEGTTREIVAEVSDEKFKQSSATKPIELSFGVGFWENIGMADYETITFTFDTKNAIASARKTTHGRVSDETEFLSFFNAGIDYVSKKYTEVFESDLPYIKKILGAKTFNGFVNGILEAHKKNGAKVTGVGVVNFNSVKNKLVGSGLTRTRWYENWISPGTLLDQIKSGEEILYDCELYGEEGQCVFDKYERGRLCFKEVGKSEQDCGKNCLCPSDWKTGSAGHSFTSIVGDQCWKYWFEDGIAIESIKQPDLMKKRQLSCEGIFKE